MKRDQGNVDPDVKKIIDAHRRQDMFYDDIANVVKTTGLTWAKARKLVWRRKGIGKEQR
jgi:hypothetical protein